jgi:hypothetical protein
MEAFKEIVSMLGAIVGILTGVITLYAKYLDLKKKAARAEAAAHRPPEQPAGTQEEPIPYVIPVSDPTAVARVRQMVKAPAITLMGVGALSLLLNVLVAGYGFVDEFVTPLNPRPDVKQAAPNQGGQAADPDLDKASSAMGIVMLLSFSVASAGAVWAGYGMLHLRSYWLSVAGSFAVMPGACFCCLAGFPVGVWCLIVLLKPEVSEAFR